MLLDTGLQLPVRLTDVKIVAVMAVDAVDEACFLLLRQGFLGRISVEWMVLSGL